MSSQSLSAASSPELTAKSSAYDEAHHRSDRVGSLKYFLHLGPEGHAEGRTAQRASLPHSLRDSVVEFAPVSQRQ